MSFPRYTRYKDSGVEWLGKVPAHWEVKPLRRIVASTNAGEVIDRTFWGGTAERLYTCALEPLDCDYDGFPHWKRTTSNDLLLTRNGTPYVHKPVENAIYTNVVQRITLTPGEDRNYLATAIQNAAENLKGYGVSIESLNYEMWKALPVAIPPSPEQVSIADFLDREVEKIDRLVTEQQQLIELLKEKRHTVISHAVTKGLNPDARMKPSGIKWLGNVPSHWTVLSVRRVVQRIEQGWSPECLGRPAEADEWGVVKSGCVNRGVFVAEENKALPDNLDPIPEYEINAGDVLMSRASGSPELVGSTAYILQTRPRLMLSDKIFRLHAAPIVDPQFLVAIFNSRVMRSQIERAISGAEGLANNLPQSAIRGFFCVLPPKEEQRAILGFVEQELAKVDGLTSITERAIDLLQERRTALISAAVTGQIDVRDLVESDAA